MKVIKRDRRTQDFDIDKIKITLIRAAEEAKTPFNESDIDMISKVIKKTIMNDFNGVIRSKEIRCIVLEELRKLGFDNVADLYDNYIKHN
ncbi:ATP cone domain-containing protein [uncultured Clostridium sp.]|uniref:ATP cone domain-containing protein n=1 Tax=uncultured Clostridium sp. TaxID=59620 RepID=UPI0028E9A2C1|nr:ATP cone domain-containing protein [uncultured Clostridium sp.]